MTHEEESLNCKAKIRDFIEQDLEYRMEQLRAWSKWIDDLAYKAMLLSMLDSLKKSKWSHKMIIRQVGCVPAVGIIRS